MSTLRRRLAIALASVVLVCGAIGVGCHKWSSTESDDDETPSAPSDDGDVHAIARKLGLDRSQENRFAESEARDGHHRGAGRGRRLERRVQRITRELGLTPEQTDKLRGILREMAERDGERRGRMPGAEDPRFPQGEGPQGGWRMRRGGQGDPDSPQGGGRRWRGRGRGFPQGGPGFPQGGPGFPQGDRDDPQGFHPGGHGFPQGEPDEPQDPQEPGYPGPQDPGGPREPSSI
jgi:hypothetical protein